MTNGEFHGPYPDYADSPRSARPLVSTERVIALIQDGVFWECCSCAKCDVECHAIDTKASKQNLIDAITALASE